MIALERSQSRQQLTWQAGYEQLLPAIKRAAGRALAHMAGEEYDDAFAEVLAQTCLAYRSLFEQGKEDLAYPAALVRFAVARYRSGRRAGSSVNCRDVCSKAAQAKGKFTVVAFDPQRPEWIDEVTDSRRQTVPDQVAFRLDFTAWLGLLSSRNRRLAEYLALGNSTNDAAARFHVSAGRVSQLRAELNASWLIFRGSS